MLTLLVNGNPEILRIGDPVPTVVTGANPITDTPPPGDTVVTVGGGDCIDAIINRELLSCDYQATDYRKVGADITVDRVDWQAAYIDENGDLMLKHRPLDVYSGTVVVPADHANNTSIIIPIPLMRPTSVVSVTIADASFDATVTWDGNPWLLRRLPCPYNAYARQGQLVIEQAYILSAKPEITLNYTWYQPGELK